MDTRMSRKTENISEAVKMTYYAMELIAQKKVRNHKLRNSAPVHTGEIEKRECKEFCEFLQTKNSDFVYNLRGSDKAE